MYGVDQDIPSTAISIWGEISYFNQIYFMLVADLLWIRAMVLTMATFYLQINENNTDPLK
jgi:hypothetical protein